METSMEIKFVPKGWGFEKWIVNCEQYCGKLLYFAKGKRCSWHFHKLKDEVFYVQSGKILVKYSDNDDLQEAKEINVYKSVDYSKKPRTYCGMEITDNPLFDK